MGRIRITCQSQWGERELATSTLVGRHWSCDVILHSPDVPLRWLELRWMASQWGWRALTQEGDTLGAGAWLRPGWRKLELGEGGRRQLRLRQVAAVELVDADPPQPFAVDLRTGRILRQRALEERLAAAGYPRWRGPSGRPLDDGAVLLVEEEVLRLHLPQRAQRAPDMRLSILHPDTLIKLDIVELTGAVEVGPTCFPLQGEMVRVLLPYVEARLEDDHAEGGWLTRDEAFARWLELGGNPTSRSQRLGWLRGKVREHLARCGLTGLEGLFESRRINTWYGTRIGLQPEQLIIH